ncbi:SlyX family protein [Bowmanella sp. JS7-9]|uniref:Protein SlyX homolog n=1 Tax=Pseudobowmanella zhangzhouensis TaxID=1537679 RepID=A0ABW1XEH2_9ALTE|nr:SlyX family protein [Bowmanella sp. JS7-9]TBX20913.1 SlyX [Bowmanella sp. JS7-9]
MSTPEYIEALETKLAFLEATVDELNQALTDQQSQLDKMQFQIRFLTEKMQQQQVSNIASMAEETPPPHY